MIYIFCRNQLLYEGGSALSETSCEIYSHGYSTIYDRHKIYYLSSYNTEKTFLYYKNLITLVQRPGTYV